MEEIRDSVRFDRMVVVSFVLHCLLLVLISLFWNGADIPPVRTVQLAIESRAVSREVIAEVRRESAPAKDKRDSQEKGAADDSLENLLERSSFPHKPALQRDRPNRRRDDDFDYGSLRRDAESPAGRLERNPDSKDMQAHRPSLTDRDTRDIAGRRDSFGRDDLTKQGGKNAPGLTGADFAQQGARGAGVTGLANLRGRSCVYQPAISLPERYSRQGLSYTVQVEIHVAEEGIVSRAAVLEPSGDPELDLLLEQRARMFRFEPAAAGSGIQTGMISFSIQPR